MGLPSRFLLKGWPGLAAALTLSACLSANPVQERLDQLAHDDPGIGRYGFRGGVDGSKLWIEANAPIRDDTASRASAVRCIFELVAGVSQVPYRQIELRQDGRARFTLSRTAAEELAQEYQRDGGTQLVLMKFRAHLRTPEGSPAFPRRSPASVPSTDSLKDLSTDMRLFLDGWMETRHSAEPRRTF